MKNNTTTIIIIITITVAEKIEIENRNALERCGVGGKEMIRRRSKQRKGVRWKEKKDQPTKRSISVVTEQQIDDHLTQSKQAKPSKDGHCAADLIIHRYHHCVANLPPPLPIDR